MRLPPDGQLDGTALEIGPAPVLGEPVRELERRIAQGAGERVAQLARRRVGAQLDEEVSDGRPRQSGVQQADQEHQRREADREERDAPDGLERDLSIDQPVDGREEEERKHHETQRERLDEQRRPAAPRPAFGAPPPEDEHDPGQAQATEHHQLGLQQRIRALRLGCDGEQIVGAEAPERHADELDAERRDIPGADEQPLQAPAQPAGRKGEEDVQEQHRRQ